MVHRLDPRYPLVWRSPASVQVGVDPARVVLEEVAPATERMLSALVDGATTIALTVISGGADPLPLLDALAPVLLTPEPEAGNGIAVYGVGGTAMRIRALLEERGRWHGAAPDSEPRPDAVVIVSHFVTPPGARSGWLRRDVPHLPVVFSDTGVVVGPLVRPGLGPCLTCVEFHHRDRDRAWPALAAQLIDRVSTADHGTLSAEAAATALRMLAGPDRGAIAVRIDGATGERTQTEVAPHPQCTCTGDFGSAQFGEEAARGA